MQRGEIGSYDVTASASSGFGPLYRCRCRCRRNRPWFWTARCNNCWRRRCLPWAASTASRHEALFLYAYVRKEAVLSSQIEGTRSSLSDLLLFELEEAPGVPLDDVREVSNYVAALHYGLSRLRENFPLSNRLLRETHGVLLSRGRGSDQLPGEFRRSQNWIGGSRPGNAAFVPPPHTAVPDCMAALERFLHAEDDGLSVLLRSGLAHVQFETIHPFLDGNGRVGRLLITLLLCQAGLLRQPLLYLSLYFKQHRGVYYDLLNHVRRSGDWEAWLAFFLEGVKLTAEGAVSTAQRLSRMFQDDRNRIQAAGGVPPHPALLSDSRLGHGTARHPRDSTRDHRQAP